MKKLPLIVCLLLAAALVAVWSMNQRTKAELQQQTAALQQAQASVEELRAENERIKAQITEAGATGSEQMSELLKLRGEVSRLRQAANELNTLRAQNEQLRQAAGASPVASRATNAPPDVPPQDIHPKETWSFSGYATPDATVQSMLWAMTQTNLDVMLHGLGPEMAAQFEQAIQQNGEKAVAGMTQLATRNTGFRIVNRSTISADEMDLTVYMEGQNRQDTAKFKRIDGEWKLMAPVR